MPREGRDATEDDCDALAVAIVIGTPGCEIAVWDELLGGRAADESPSSAMSCVVGLHIIDELEASRRRADAGQNHDI